MSPQTAYRIEKPEPMIAIGRGLSSAHKLQIAIRKECLVRKQRVCCREGSRLRRRKSNSWTGVAIRGLEMWDGCEIQIVKFM